MSAVISSPPNSVLVVLLGAIGDVTRALPLVVRIKNAWPDCKITWAVEPKSRELLDNHPAVDEVIVFQRHGGWPAFRSFLKELRSSRYDVTLDLQRHLKSGVVSWSSRSRRRIGFHRKNAKEGNWLFNNYRVPVRDDRFSKIRHYQLFGDLLGLPPLEPLDFGLMPDEALSKHAEYLIERAFSEIGVQTPAPDRRVAFIIGSSWKSKLWPARGFSELSERLYREAGVLPIFVGGAGEAPLVHEIRAYVPNVPCASVVGRTKLRELAAVFTRVRIAVGSDSGPAHIAAAVGTPVVTLWGPSDPVRNAPYRNESRILQSAIGCAPCLRRTCPGLDNLCMFDIPAKAVFQSVRTITDARLKQE